MVGLGLVLAGCAGTGNHNGLTTSTPTADQLTPSGAQSMLAAAVAGVPDQFAMSAGLYKGSTQTLAFNASFDNVSKTSYVELHGDPSALGQATQGSAATSSILKDGFSLYISKEGSLYLANGSAFVFPPGNASKSSSLVPSPERSPFNQFFDPEHVIGAFQGSNVTVLSVEPITCHDQAAVRVVFSSSVSNQTTNATADLFNANPPRICHLETILPHSGGPTADPLGGASTRVDFYYNGELGIKVPEAATRSLGLRYSSDKPAFSHGGSSDQPSDVTWTFEHDGGIATSDAVVEVKDLENASTSSSANSIPNVGAMPTLWSMKLSEGTKTQNGVTLTFTDNDGDHKVSPGDTLLIHTDAGQAPATVALKDAKTGVYVVPGPGLALVLGLVGLAALAFRRRD